MFLFDEGLATLETLDFTFHIGRPPTFYISICISMFSAYAGHYIYLWLSLYGTTTWYFILTNGTYMEEQGNNWTSLHLRVQWRCINIYYYVLYLKIIGRFKNNNNLFRITTSPKCFSVGSCKNYVQYSNNTIRYYAIRCLCLLIPKGVQLSFITCIIYERLLLLHILS